MTALPRTRIAAVGLCLLIHASSCLSLTDALAQEQDLELAVDENGTCPTEAQFRQLPELRHKGSEGVGFTFVLSKDINVFRTNAARPRKVEKNLVDFERVRLYQLDPELNQIFVRAMSGGFCGWVEAEGLMQASKLAADRQGLKALRLGPRPLRVSDVLRADSKGALLDLKVTLHSLNTRSVNPDEAITLYREPGVPMVVNGSERQLRVYDIFHVFDIKDAKNPRGGSPQVDFYLIGRSGQNPAILGWLHEEDAHVWNSRVAAFWAGTRRALGYKEERTMTDSSKAQFYEPPNLFLPENKTVQRFPIVQERRKNPYTKRKAIQLIIPGIICKRGQSDPDCKQSQRDEIDRIDLTRRQQNFRNIDILFLIDATSSMEPYFKATVKAVLNYVEDLRRAAGGPSEQASRGTIYVGAAVYGDYVGMADIDRVAYRQILSLSNIRQPAAVRRLRERLHGVRTIKDEEEDRLEAPFAAIIKAAGSRWRKDAATRIIIHIADHGNRIRGRTSEETRQDGKRKSDLEETIDFKNVGDALKRHRVRLAPVAVVGKWVEAANRRHRVFSRTLHREYGMHVLKPAESYDPNSAARPDEDSVTTIHETLNRAIPLAEWTTEISFERVLCAQSSDPPACERGLAARIGGNWMARIALGIAEDQGFTAQQLSNIYSRKQTVTPAWFEVETPRGAPLFTYWLAPDREALQAVSKAFEKVCQTFGNPFNLRDAMVDLLQAATGDKRAHADSLSEFLDKAFSLPAQSGTGLLNRDWDGLDRTMRRGTTVEIAKLQKHACRVDLLLRKALDQRAIDLDRLRWNQRSSRWTYPDSAERRFEWLFKSSQGLELYYIPLEFLDEP